MRWKSVACFKLKLPPLLAGVAPWPGDLRGTGRAIVYRGFTRSASMSICSTISELTDVPTTSGYFAGAFKEDASLRGLLSWSTMQSLETPQTPVVVPQLEGRSHRTRSLAVTGFWSRHVTSGFAGAPGSDSEPRQTTGFLKWLRTHRPRVVRPCADFDAT